MIQLLALRTMPRLRGQLRLEGSGIANAVISERPRGDGGVCPTLALEEQGRRDIERKKGGEK